MFFVRFVTFYRHLSNLCYGLAIMVRQVSPTTTKFAAQTKTTIIINNLKNYAL